MSEDETSKTTVSVAGDDLDEYTRYDWTAYEAENQEAESDAVELTVSDDRTSVEIKAVKGGKVLICANAYAENRSKNGPGRDETEEAGIPDVQSMAKTVITVTAQGLPTVENGIEGTVGEDAVTAPVVEDESLSETELKELQKSVEAQVGQIKTSILNLFASTNSEVQSFISDAIKGTDVIAAKYGNAGTGETVKVYPKLDLQNVDFDTEVIRDSVTGAVSVKTSISKMTFDIDLYMQKMDETAQNPGEAKKLVIPSGNKEEIEFPILLPETGINEKVNLVEVTHRGEKKTYPIKEGEGFRYIMVSVRNFSEFTLEFKEKTCKVKIENVPNGVLIVNNAEWGTADYMKYLPIGEEVELPYGTELDMYAQGSWMDFGDYEGQSECRKILKTADGVESVIESDYDYVSYTVTEDAVIKAVFEKPEETGDEARAVKFRIYAAPDSMLREGMYSGQIHVMVRDGNRRWVLAQGAKVELNTEATEDRYATDLFTYDSGNNLLKSKAALKTGYYRLPLVITYQGETYTTNPGSGTDRPLQLIVSVGVDAIYLVKLADDKYQEDEYGNAGNIEVGNSYFAYQPEMTYAPLLDDETNLENYVFYEDKLPAMYNYTYKGWTDNGKTPLKDSQKVTPNDFGEVYLYAYFVNEKTGEAYKPPTVKTDGSSPEEPDTPADKPSRHSGGHSSGSSYSNSSIHGTWELVNGLWKFKQFDGTYAANQWGKINTDSFYFDANGNMVTGWNLISGVWYYLNPEKGANEGKMVTGWIFDAMLGRWFYADQTGSMLTGWQFINGKWYYLNPISDGSRGAMVTDAWIDGKYLGADGVRAE